MGKLSFKFSHQLKIKNVLKYFMKCSMLCYFQVLKLICMNIKSKDPKELASCSYIFVFSKERIQYLFTFLHAQQKIHIYYAQERMILLLLHPSIEKFCFQYTLFSQGCFSIGKSEVIPFITDS